MLKVIMVIGLMVLAGYGGYHGGSRYEALTVQATCESENEVTVLDSQQYVCVPVATWNVLVQRFRRSSGGSA